VTDPSFTDQRRDVDHGTRLGLGTRALTAIMRWTVRTGRLLARGGRAIAARLSFLVPPLERVARRIGRWLAVALSRSERILRWILIGLAVVCFGPTLVLLGIGAGVALQAELLLMSALAVVLAIPVAIVVSLVIGIRALRPRLVPVWRALRGALDAIGSYVRRVGRSLTAAWQPIGRSLVGVGRALSRFFAAATRSIGALLATVGHAVTRATRAVFRPIRRIAAIVGRALAAVTTVLGRTLSRALAIVGRAIAAVAVTIGRAVVAVVARPVRAIARALAVVATTIGRANAPALAVVATTIGRAIAAVATTIGRAVVAVVARPVRAIARALGRALGSVGRAVGSRLERAVTAVGFWFATVTRRVVHSVGVAAGRAREPLDSGAPAWDLSAPVARANAAVPPFTVEVFHNEYLPDGGTRVDAIITVTAQATTAADAPAQRERSEVILVDCSGSMGHPWRKIRNARAATAAAIDALPDGTWFAVVRANHDAETVYPPHGGLAPKTPETQAAADRALRHLLPEGGTAMGRWLLLARDLLATRPGAIPNAILLTDGRNESESPDALAAALRSCAGRFQCDCRGVGTDWEVAELRTIADDLLGTVDIVAHPDDLVADFRAMAASAAARQVDRVGVRVWTPAGASLRFFRQVAPHIVDLGGRPIQVDNHTVDFPTGAWSEETRDYHLCVDLPPRPVGTEMLAARVSLAVGHQVTAQALVNAVWTQDLERSSRIVPEVVHYTGQAELLRAVQEGMEAHARGDDETVTSRLGVATRLAFESGNDATLRLLANVVEIEDAATGRVHPRASVDDVDRMALETRSTRTARVASAVF